MEKENDNISHYHKKMTGKRLNCLYEIPEQLQIHTSKISKDQVLDLSSNDSTSEMSCSSDFDSEIGYASDEKDGSGEGETSKLRRNKLPRKKLNRKHDSYMLKRSNLYSNDSDTTIEGPVVNRRKSKVSTKKFPENSRKNDKFRSIAETDVFAEDTCLERGNFRSQNGRNRNESKTSWTDSGVSMSKTDSQPSTLGERPVSVSAMSAMSARLESKERLQQDVERRDSTRPIHKQEIDEVRKPRNEDRMVALVRRDVKHRSKSVNEFAKLDYGSRKVRSESVPNPIYSKPKIDVNESESKAVQMRTKIDVGSKAAENRNYIGGKKPPRTRKIENVRCPEIIKRADIERGCIITDKKAEIEASTGGSHGDSQDPSQYERFVKRNSDIYNEKEKEIIQQLVQNAKEEETRRISVQSDISNETNSSFANDFKRKSEKTRLQKLMSIFRVKRKNLVRNQWSRERSCASNAETPSASPAHSRFLDDSWSQGNCQNQFCFCDVDDDQTRFPGNDQLANLARDVCGKKKNVFKRIFGFSNKNRKSSCDCDERSGWTRRQTVSGMEFARKRLGSTRSLPESLRDLWNRARSRSVENLKIPLHDNKQKMPNMNFRRSTSNYSLHNYQFNPFMSNKNSESVDVIPCPHSDLRIPLSPVRRSRSLRSLNIGGNFDIATHLLHANRIDEKNNENNNLFHHPYFEGHTNHEENTDQCQFEQPDSSASTSASPQISYGLNYDRQCFCGCSYSSKCQPKVSSPFLNAISPVVTSAVYGKEDFEQNYIFADHLYDPRAQPQDHAYFSDMRGHGSRGISPHDEAMVIAPLSITVMQEKHAEKIRLKCKSNIDTFV